jgi:NAD(P)-dependent dehydrogenase (short-subunit alcohol dehydrogenase family)
VYCKATTSALYNKLVVITGASSGIGRAAAHAFASEGARLLLGRVTKPRSLKSSKNVLLAVP